MRFTLSIIIFRRGIAREKKYGHGWEKENVKCAIRMKITLAVSKRPPVEDTIR